MEINFLICLNLEHGRSPVVLRQLRELPLPQVLGQRASATLPDYGQVQPEENLHRFYLQGLLCQHQKGALLWLLYAGNGWGQIRK